MRTSEKCCSRDRRSRPEAGFTEAGHNDDPAYNIELGYRIWMDQRGDLFYRLDFVPLLPRESAFAAAVEPSPVKPNENYYCLWLADSKVAW